MKTRFIAKNSSLWVIKAILFLRKSAYYAKNTVKSSCIHKKSRNPVPLANKPVRFVKMQEKGVCCPEKNFYVNKTSSIDRKTYYSARKVISIGVKNRLVIKKTGLIAKRVL